MILDPDEQLCGTKSIVVRQRLFKYTLVYTGVYSYIGGGVYTN
jgi:hypothetical protein